MVPFLVTSDSLSPCQHRSTAHQAVAPHLSRHVTLHALMLAAQLHQLEWVLHRAHESGTQSQEHERQAALLAFEQERGRQQQVLQAEHQAALQVMQTERYWFDVRLLHGTLAASSQAALQVMQMEHCWPLYHLSNLTCTSESMPVCCRHVLHLGAMADAVALRLLLELCGIYKCWTVQLNLLHPGH